MPAITPILADTMNLPSHHVSRVWKVHSTTAISALSSWGDVLTIEDAEIDEPGHLLVIAAADWEQPSGNNSPYAHMRLRLDSETGPEHLITTYRSANLRRNHSISHMWEVDAGMYDIALQQQRDSSQSQIRIVDRVLVAVLLKR